MAHEWRQVADLDVWLVSLLFTISFLVSDQVDSWPAEFEMPDPKKIAWLYHETGEASYRASQFMAIEGQCFVLVASQILTEKNLEKNNLSGNPVTKTVRFPFLLPTA